MFLLFSLEIKMIYIGYNMASDFMLGQYNDYLSLLV
jgi:hypothetical protein